MSSKILHGNNDKYKLTIYFFCCEQGPPNEARYQYGILPLAEGLRELGVACYSNLNYWQIDTGPSEYLFQHHEDVKPENCDVVVLNDRWFRYGNPMPENIFKENRQYVTVYIDCADGVFTRSFKPEWRKFDLILKAHFNNRMLGIPKNMKAWAFGMPSRIIRYTRSKIPWADRKPVFLSNFRVYHSLRATAKQVLYPLISDFFTIDDASDNFIPPEDETALMEWARTGRRHNPAYYEKLRQSQAISCFGGQYTQPVAHPFLLQRVMNRIADYLPPKLKILSQWDSFRLWEAFGAGCLVFHADLAKEGCLMPVMPKNGCEYVGFDLKNPQRSWKWVKQLQPYFEEIAERGRKWAMENYSPMATAKRFLSEIDVC